MNAFDKLFDILNLSHQSKKVTGNIAWLVGGHLFRMVVGVVVLAWVARYLGPDQFGILNYAIGLAALFTAVATLGMDGVVVRELVKEPEKTRLILGTAYVMRVAGGLAAVLMAFCLGLSMPSQRSILPLIVLVSLAFLPQSFEVIDLWFQKNIQSKFTVVAKVFAVLAGGGVKIALVILKAPLILFCVAYVLDFALIALALTWIYFIRGERMLSWDWSRRIAGGIFRDCWPLMVSGILVAAYMRIEQILVMNVLGSYSAGIYYASFKLTEVWAFIPSFILSSVYPALVERRRQDLGIYKKRLQLAFDLLTGIGFLLAITVCLLAPVIIFLLYGPDYHGAAVILMIHAWTAVVVFSGWVRGQYFLLENINIYNTWCAIIGIALNMGLAFPLMGWLGAKGAAVSALIGYTASIYGTSFLFPRLRECASFQTKAFLLPFRLPALLRNLRNFK